MSATSIEWATHVWNPFTGCDRVSPGYALDYAARLKAMGQPKYQADGGRSSGPGFGFTVHWDMLHKPERFLAGARVFVNSMSDVFHEDAPPSAIGELFARMALQPDVDFLILTKRAERMREILGTVAFPAFVAWAVRCIDRDRPPMPWPIPNVWLGVSIENRRFVGRADLLRETPAAVRLVSAEPLLGPLIPRFEYSSRPTIGGSRRSEHRYRWPDGYGAPGLRLHGIDWLIVGGESGPRHRRIDPDWVRDLRDDAELEHVAFFFKQWGGRTPKAGGRELDGRTWDEFPTREAVPA